jgi:uncharacterized protein YndB with AHSA1/START domain
MNIYSVRCDLTIDRSPEDVWRHLVQYEEWNPEYDDATVTTLAGDKDEEGEVVLIQKAFGPPFEMTVAKLVPGEQLVWVIYSPESRGTEGISFIDITLRAIPGGSTQCTYSLYGWRKPQEGQGEFDRVAYESSIATRLDEVLPALKAYVEAP